MVNITVSRWDARPGRPCVQRWSGMTTERCENFGWEMQRNALRLVTVPAMIEAGNDGELGDDRDGVFFVLPVLAP